MQDRRRQVLEVSQRLFLEKGFAQTSIQDIIQTARISKGTFYNYFASKNECLIAILKHAQKEAFDRRKQLLLTYKKDDETIFAKQIVIRMQVNQEQNLLPLFGFVFHSKDEELRTFAKRYHLHEIAWLSERFIEVYGAEVRPYAVDCAVFVLGLSQQYSLVWSFYVEDEINTERLIAFILHRMKAVVDDFIKHEQSFIHQSLLSQVESIWRLSDDTYDLIDELGLLAQRCVEDNGKSIEYIQFISDEIDKSEPRLHLVEAIFDSLIKHCQDEKTQDKIKNIKKRLIVE